MGIEIALYGTIPAINISNITVLENMSCDILLQWSGWLTGSIIRPIATGITHTPIAIPPNQYNIMQS